MVNREPDGQAGPLLRAMSSQSAAHRLECLVEYQSSFILSPALVSSQRKRTKKGVGSHMCKLTKVSSP